MSCVHTSQYLSGQVQNLRILKFPGISETSCYGVLDRKNSFKNHRDRADSINSAAWLRFLCFVFWLNRTREVLHSMTFSSAASQLISLPRDLDQEKRAVVLGFDDGTVRSISRCRDGWKLLSAFKPHKVRRS